MFYNVLNYFYKILKDITEKACLVVLHGLAGADGLDATAGQGCVSRNTLSRISGPGGMRKIRVDADSEWMRGRTDAGSFHSKAGPTAWPGLVMSRMQGGAPESRHAAIICRSLSESESASTGPRSGPPVSGGSGPIPDADP
jgi:hypothetical protein